MSQISELKKLYSKGKARKLITLFSFFIALVVAAVASVSVGAGSPRLAEAIHVIMAKLFPFLNLAPASRLTQIIILDLRLPRVILAVIAGAALAASGTLMQAALRNPLVSPYILGVSSAAGFGAALFIVLGISTVMFFKSYFIVANAFIFSVVAMLIVYGIARIRGITAESIILAGVAVGYLFSALLSLIQFIAPASDAVRAVVFWLLGGLSTANWSNLTIILPMAFAAIALMMLYSWDLNVLSLGEEAATSLGVNPRSILIASIVLSAWATASIISFTGVIGFVDLISPHIARIVIGSDHRFQLPCSALIGALLLLCADTTARVLLAPAEIPVGIVTSLMGVPFFLYLLMSRRRQIWR